MTYETEDRNSIDSPNPTKERPHPHWLFRARLAAARGNDA
jgi:hypothetical protein